MEALCETIELLYDKVGTVGKFSVVNLYRKNSVAFDFCLENNMLPACPGCKRAFLAKPETGELFCDKCNRIEVVDGTVFLPEQHRKKESYPSKWGFKYYLDHLLGNDFLEKLGSIEDPSGKLLLFKLKQKIIEQKIRPDLYKYSTLLLRELSCRNLPVLTYERRSQINYLYKRISNYLPKNISYAFICYKLLSSILQGPQREILLFIKQQKPVTHQKNELHWRSACRAAGLTCRRRWLVGDLLPLSFSGEL